MKIEAITNRSISFDTALSEELGRCSIFNIASAFIDDAAVDKIETCLKRNHTFKSGRLLISVYECFNKKTTLERLNALAKRHAAIFSVHISRDKRLHWKYYQFNSSKKHIVFVGSANFTTAGLGSNGEIVVKMTDAISNQSKDIAQILSTFEDEWANSGSISEFRIGLYKEIKRQPGMGTEFPPELEAFFDKKKTNAGERGESSKAVLLYLTDDLAKETERAIRNYKPTWQENAYSYFVCPDKRVFDQCKDARRYLILCRVEKGIYYACCVYYTGSCELKTPDGKYFISYRDGIKWKKLSPKMVARLTDKDEYGFKLEGRVRVLGTKSLTNKQMIDLENLIGISFNN